MQRKAHAKINWALSVVGIRADGYHLLDMLMQTVGLSDTLTFTDAPTLTLRVTGDVPVPADDDNLVLRAARLLRAHAGIDAGAEILLEKHIPSGAGLGGGSADAAATLWGLNALWGLGLSLEALEPLGLRLGADVPFCLRGGLARVRGIGEVIAPLYPAPEMDLVIVQPEQGLSTPVVFRKHDEMPSPTRAIEMDAVADALTRGDRQALATAMGNDLQAAAVALLPEIAACVTALSAAGAVRAQMTGSGSAVIGLFASTEEATLAAEKCRTRWRRAYQMKSVSEVQHT